MTGSLYELDDYGEHLELQLKNLILPALVLGIRPLAVVIQLMRNSLLEVFNQDYIISALKPASNNCIQRGFKSFNSPVLTVHFPL